MIHLSYLNYMNPARPTGNTTATRGGMLLWARERKYRAIGRNFLVPEKTIEKEL